MNATRILGSVLLVAALFVGSLSVAPHFLARQALGDAYQGIPFFYTDNEDFYIARSQEILDGHTEAGSPYFFEYKNHLTVQPPLGEYLHATVSRLTGVSLVTVFLAAKFVLPALLFLLVACLVLLLLKDEEPKMRGLIAVVAGFGATIGYDMLGPHALLAALRGQNIGSYLSFGTRPINPITGALGLFGCLLLLWNLWKSKRIVVAVISGILLGLLDCYFFSWALGLAITGLLLLVAMIDRDVRRSIAFSIVLGIGLLMNAQMFLSFLGNPTGQFLALRNGLLLMHEPLLNKTLLLALAIFMGASFVLMRQGSKLKTLVREPWWIFSLIFLLGGLVALNQQVLTGRAIWPYHFVQYTKPLAWLVSLVAVTHAVRGSWKTVWFFACSALAAFLLFQSMVAASTYRSMESDFRIRQSWAPVFSWLLTTPKDSVVLAEGPLAGRLSGWIPAFTSNNVYTSPYAMSGVDQDRLEHNVFVEMRFDGVSSTDARVWLDAHSGSLRGIFYRDFFDVFQRRKDDGWFSSVLDGLAVKYVDFTRNDFRAELSKYRIDYLVLDNGYASATRAELGLEEVAALDPYRIYRFQP
jgi:hypothetical protein